MSVTQRSIHELKAAMAAGPVCLIDVRTPGEFAGGHIEGAQNIPLSSLSSAELEQQPVWLICRSGGRSARGAAELSGRGVEVVDVAGGMSAWSSAGLPKTASTGKQSLLWPVVASLTLGLAPLSPEPHLLGKLKWVAGGAEGMGAMDWFDLAMHGAPWAWLLIVLASRLRPPAK